MMQRWGYGVLVILAIALLGGLIYNDRPQPPDSLLVNQLGYRLFPTITQPEQILGMELVIPEEEFALAVVVEDNQEIWRLREAPFSRVNGVEPRDAREILAFMEGIAAFERRDLPLEAFGLLPNPQYVVRFQLDNLQVITLYVGNKNPLGDAYYVSSGESSVIVDEVLSAWIDNFVLAMLSIKPYEESSGETQLPGN